MRLDEALDKVHRGTITDFKNDVTQSEDITESLDNWVAKLGRSSAPKDKREILLQIAKVALREVATPPKYLGGNEPLGEDVL